MSVLTVTARGQVTFRKDVLQHLGVRPGEKIELDKLPDGRVALRAVRRTRSIDEVFGMLKGKGNGACLSIDEINEAIAKGGAAAGLGEEA
jgi:bifunctional DNA-binding transcriptional regulator/antitoxin component of YhaV-PrlF toxin-antitoxin module